MMHQEDYFGYSNRDSFSVLQMEYVGCEVAMMVILPHSLNSIEELENQLTPCLFKELATNLECVKVKVSMPKFKFEYSNSMKNTFQALGLNAVFGYKADLANISSDNVYVSEVIHKARISVNEFGSEAAAATAIMMENCCFMGPVPNFTVDHPFLFIVYHLKNDIILFVGKMDEF